MALQQGIPEEVLSEPGRKVSKVRQRFRAMYRCGQHSKHTRTFVVAGLGFDCTDVDYPAGLHVRRQCMSLRLAIREKLVPGCVVMLNNGGFIHPEKLSP